MLWTAPPLCSLLRLGLRSTSTAAYFPLAGRFLAKPIISATRSGKTGLCGNPNQRRGEHSRRIDEIWMTVGLAGQNLVEATECIGDTPLFNSRRFTKFERIEACR